MKKKTFFLHIPKTAGSTLRAVFKRNYGDAFELIPGNDPVDGLTKAKESNSWKRKELIWLHGDWESCNGADVLTMLREPIARMESFYYYVKSQPDHYLHKFCAENDAIRFFEEAETLETHNGQCRILAGYGGYHGMNAGRNDEVRGQELLNVARKNLFEQTIAFGLQSRFVDSLMVFEKKLNWQRGIKFNTVNKRASSYKTSSLNKKELDCVKRLNALDIELYEEAEEQFQEQFDKVKSTFRIMKYKLTGR
ncbi:sulfotransferase family 2 domain-containing protein [Parvicella tangerina]|uniref:Sulfotransferase family protein n=1 Tax=Parvicella tangerina TaxID=2829795 RepID=A0A916JLB6_9FLAO|nr:sulfotransferase family 2 domain-containing protein [Parvicella tangerina]CAG5079716.1 hypothetical protein CRYO30217_01031 [Parvicella tangerina]